MLETKFIKEYLIWLIILFNADIFHIPTNVGVILMRKVLIYCFIGFGVSFCLINLSWTISMPISIKSIVINIGLNE